MAPNTILIRYLKVGDCFRYNGDAEILRVIGKKPESLMVYSLDSGLIYGLSPNQAWGVLVADDLKVATGQRALFRTAIYRSSKLSLPTPPKKELGRVLLSPCCSGKKMYLNVAHTHYICQGCNDALSIFQAEKYFI